MKKKYDRFENEIVEAYEKGELISTEPSKAELENFRYAARLTSIKNRRVNIRLSFPDLMDLQARALEEGIPYQTLIASVLHKYVSGRLVEKTSPGTYSSIKRTKMLRAG
jgi:predicted DNA binding CopG/RHH family protein